MSVATRSPDPGLIVGPGDPSDRFGYWPARLSMGRAVLTPNTTHRFVQVIDVGDLATWIGGEKHGGATGVVNAVGVSHTMDAFFGDAARVTGFSGSLVPADDEVLLAHDVQYWSGPRSLPLWLPAEYTGFAHRDRSRFGQLGGTVRPLAETLQRALADEQRRGVHRPRSAGLTQEEEDAVLAQLQ